MLVPTNPGSDPQQNGPRWRISTAERSAAAKRKVAACSTAILKNGL